MEEIASRRTSGARLMRFARSNADLARSGGGCLPRRVSSLCSVVGRDDDRGSDGDPGDGRAGCRYVGVTAGYSPQC